MNKASKDKRRWDWIYKHFGISTKRNPEETAQKADKTEENIEATIKSIFGTIIIIVGFFAIWYTANVIEDFTGLDGLFNSKFGSYIGMLVFSPVFIIVIFALYAVYEILTGIFTSISEFVYRIIRG